MEFVILSGIGSLLVCLGVVASRRGPAWGRRFFVTWVRMVLGLVIVGASLIAVAVAHRVG